jgi:NOL1/NOP2/sun family putative RNA methylase
MTQEETPESTQDQTDLEAIEPTDEQESILTPIPQRVDIKPAFVERYQRLLGPRYDEFLQYSLSYITKSIRVNTLKISVDELRKRLEKDWLLTPVPWCAEGFFLEYRHGKRFDIGNLPEHQLGFIYIQDAASMIPPVVLSAKPGEIVLDLCSAPGSKTTQLAAAMQNRGIILANDVAGNRLKPLGLNLQRAGVMNTIVTLRANNALARGMLAFDRVLVDAPCSGTGTIRRSLKTLQMWSPGLVARLVAEQRRLIELGFGALKPGGVLVYSTCTQEPAENEGLVSWFLARHPDAEVLPIDLDIKRSDAVLSFDGEKYEPAVAACLRIYPQDNNTEGFFVAKIRKRE